MNYKKWYLEYYSEAERISDKLCALQEERKHCGGENIKELNRRIDLLRKMRLDCIEAGDTLFTRYNAKGGIAVA